MEKSLSTAHLLVRQTWLQTKFLPALSITINLMYRPVLAVENLIDFVGSGICSYDPLIDNLTMHLPATSSIFFNVGRNSLWTWMTSPIRFFPLPLTIMHFSEINNRSRFHTETVSFDSNKYLSLVLWWPFLWYPFHSFST